MPQYLSLEAQSLLRSLFKRNPANRLGSGPGKGNEVKSHEFFASIDFEQLLTRSVKPPYIPAPNECITTQLLHPEILTDSPGVPASAGAVELFRGFSFEAPLLLDDDMMRDPRTPGVGGVGGGGGGGATAGSSTSSSNVSSLSARLTSSRM